MSLSTVSQGDELGRNLDIHHYIRYRNIKAGENYGLVYFSSTISMTQVLQANTSIRPVAPQIPWLVPLFCINKSFRMNGLHLQRELDTADDLDKGPADK